MEIGVVGVVLVAEKFGWLAKLLQRGGGQADDMLIHNADAMAGKAVREGTEQTTREVTEETVEEVAEETTEEVAERAGAKIDDSVYENLREHEQRTVERLAENPDYADRTFYGNSDPNGGYDFHDDLGATYDAIGDGSKSQYYRQDQFLQSVDSHLLKSNDNTVIDMTGYTPEQIADVSEHLDNLPDLVRNNQQTDIIRVGF